MVFNTGPYTVLPDNSILNTANMQSETGFPSSHQLKSYVASKSRLKLAARAVLSADAGLLVLFCDLFIDKLETAQYFISLKILPLKEGKGRKRNGKGGEKILEREGASGRKMERAKGVGTQSEGRMKLGDD